MNALRRLQPLPLLLLLALPACAASEASVPDRQTLLGEAESLGRGTARTYVEMVEGVPAEVGVHLSEDALHGLPTEEDEGGFFSHGHTTFETVLALPAENPTPYTHVLLNWNPGGHEPPGIYDLPHVDVHFYTISEAERAAIDPADPSYQIKAENLPAAELVPAGYILPEPLPFARMGVHWVDPLSPELNGTTFTHTFIFGSWDGQVIFAEPMITLDFLRSKQDVVAPVAEPARHAAPGYYPDAYRISWDERDRRWEIALTGLSLSR